MRCGSAIPKRGAENGTKETLENAKTLRSLPISDTSVLWGAQVRPSADKLPAALTLREKEATSLIACGLSNRQIASELFLSERTQENLVSQILRKLRLHSRAQVTAWVVEQRILR